MNSFEQNSNYPYPDTYIQIVIAPKVNVYNLYSNNRNDEIPKSKKHWFVLELNI